MTADNSIDLEGASIAMGARSQLRHFMFSAAERLSEQSNTRLHLYCAGPQEYQYYESRNKHGVFASITDGERLGQTCFTRNLDREEVVGRAQVWEERLGYSLNRLVLTNRHFGRGFSLGGFFHPRSSQSEETSYVQMLHAYCAQLDFWSDELASKAVQVCINGTHEAGAVAEYLGIPFRVLVGSRIRNLHFWARNRFYQNPEVERQYALVPEPSNEAPEPTKAPAPYHAHLASRKKLRSMFTFTHMVKSAGRTLADFSYWKLRGYEKAKGYYLRENLAYRWRIWRQAKALGSLSTTQLQDLSGTPFVYFPLHIEPETALHGISPEYFYQHSLIAAVARDLPAGVMLVVKEAFGAVGRRPSNFYRQIADLKNVIWLDPWEMGIECTKQAAAVVTICGTAGLEAVAHGTPVISFGRRNLYNFLPCVRVVEDETNLAQFLREALTNTDREGVEKQGQRLIRAIEAASFDLGSYDYIKLENFEAEAVDAACRGLRASLCVTRAEDENS